MMTNSQLQTAWPWRGKLLFRVFCLLCALCVPAPVEAQSSRATVRLDGRALFQVSSDDRERARERARTIEARLERILETPSAIPPVQIEGDGDNRLLSIAARPLLTITPDDARDNLLTTDALAAQWKNAIDAALQRAGNRRLSAWGRFGAET